MHSIICRAVIGHSRHNSCIYTKHLTLNVNKLCCRASAHMPLSSTESLHYHYITGFFRDQMLWENHIQFQFQRYSWSSSIIILHLRYVAKKFLDDPPYCTLGGFETISSSSTLSVGQDIDNISLNMKGFEI